MKNFKMIPQQTYDAWTGNEITATQWMVLLLLYQKGNPTNGKSIISYRMLAERFKPTITEVNARKIITTLRRNKWIYFKNHKGKGGYFPVYVHLFKLSSGEVQVIDRITGERKIILDDDNGELRAYQEIPGPPNSSQLLEQNHNLSLSIIPQTQTEDNENARSNHNPLN